MTAVPFPLRLRSANTLGSRDVRRDAAAFTVAYERHHDKLYRYCRSILRHDEDAQDALQSAMARAFAALQDERRDFELRPWLFRVAHNEAISILRKRRATSELDDVPDGSRELTDCVAEREELRLLRLDLADLSERQRAALVLRELNGLSHAEIGAVLELSTSGVKQAIFDARSALFKAREGRELACEVVRRKLSDGDGRVLRTRGVRAHLRSCSGCRAFQAELAWRPQALKLLAPPLPAAGAAALVSELFGGTTAKLLACAVMAGGGGKLAVELHHAAPPPPSAAKERVAAAPRPQPNVLSIETMSAPGHRAAGVAAPSGDVMVIGDRPAPTVDPVRSAPKVKIRRPVADHRRDARAASPVTADDAQGVAPPRSEPAQAGGSAPPERAEKPGNEPNGNAYGHDKPAGQGNNGRGNANGHANDASQKGNGNGRGRTGGPGTRGNANGTRNGNGRTGDSDTRGIANGARNGNGNTGEPGTRGTANGAGNGRGNPGKAATAPAPKPASAPVAEPSAAASEPAPAPTAAVESAPDRHADKSPSGQETTPPGQAKKTSPAAEISG